MDDDVIIARRYCGPPDSANGGYACGMLARRMPGDARVRLMVPPPLDVPLSMSESAPGNLQMKNGNELVAEAWPARIDAQIPEPVSFDAAIAAANRFGWVTGHPFPTCFVCGPHREHGDGLCIFPGPVPDRAIVAAPWIPDATVCNDAGQVHSEVVWAALDCPSWFGLLEFEPNAKFGLLGQLTARVLRRPRIDEQCVVIGWSIGREGRKLQGGAALYTNAGELLGNSVGLWIEPR
jgi:hypothetical protein